MVRGSLMVAPIVTLGALTWVAAARARRHHALERMAPSPTPPSAGRSRIRRLSRRTRTGIVSALLASGGAFLGWKLAGPMGAVLGTVGGGAFPSLRLRRGERFRTEAVERQLAELADTTSLALRAGLSVSRALAFAAAESVPPIRALFERFEEERRLGVPLDTALVVAAAVHLRSGGDLAGALDEVAETIRHRVGVRRELRAASAQGRISGAILGALPIAFFLVLAATSHSQLAPIYRSGAGMAMVGGGLALEGLAYAWIRRLLRIEV